MQEMRWLAPEFELTFFPSSFSHEIEESIRKLIEEINDKHPFWDPTNSLLVKKVFIYVDNQEITSEAKIEWKFEFKLIMLNIGLRYMIIDEFLKGEDGNLKLLFGREDLSEDVLDTEKLRTLLFHEFGHPLDRANPRFKFRETQALSGSQSTFVMSLWNTHIDGRLLLRPEFQRLTI